MPRRRSACPRPWSRLRRWLRFSWAYYQTPIEWIRGWQEWLSSGFDLNPRKQTVRLNIEIMENRAIPNEPLGFASTTLLGGGLLAGAAQFIFAEGGLAETTGPLVSGSSTGAGTVSLTTVADLTELIPLTAPLAVAATLEGQLQASAESSDGPPAPAEAPAPAPLAAVFEEPVWEGWFQDAVVSLFPSEPALSLPVGASEEQASPGAGDPGALPGNPSDILSAAGTQLSGPSEPPSPWSDYIDPFGTGSGSSAMPERSGLAGAATVPQGSPFEANSSAGSASAPMGEGGTTSSQSTGPGAEGDPAFTFSDGPLTITGRPASLREGRTLDDVIAQFISPDTFSSPDEFTATITWGDTQTAAGEIVPLGQGRFDVRGTHAYAQVGVYTARVTVTLASRPANTVSTDVTMTVTQAPLELHEPGGQLTFRPTVNVPYRGAVAHFIDTNTLSRPDNFEAEINWGNGVTTTTGHAFWSLGEGLYAVVGNYVYREFPPPETPYPVQVRVHDIGCGAGIDCYRAISSQAQVELGTPFRPRGDYYTVSKGSILTGEIGWFGWPDASTQPEDFQVTIDWGGPGTPGGTPTLVRRDNGFGVRGTFTYDNVGGYTIRTTVTHAIMPAGGVVESSVLVRSVPLIASPVSINAIEGQDFTTTVATFTQGSLTSGSFRAWIDWGNGRHSPSTVSYDAAAGHFVVRGTGLYERRRPVGQYGVMVTIRDEDGGATTTVTSTATVAPEEPRLIPIEDSAVVNRPWDGFVRFTGDPYAWAGNFRVTIHWGDDTSSTYTYPDIYGHDDPVISTSDAVVAAYGAWQGPRMTPGNFAVLARHTYSDLRRYDLTGSIEYDDVQYPIGGPATLGHIDVGEPPPEFHNCVRTNLIELGVHRITATEGQLFDGLVASFQENGPPPFPGPYSTSAEIFWGDATSNTVTVIAGSISGSHLYEQATLYPLRVKVYRMQSPPGGGDDAPRPPHEPPDPPPPGGDPNCDYNEASLEDGANILPATLQSTTLAPTARAGLARERGQAVSNLEVATFTAGNPSQDFAGTEINWGDGTSSPGVVEQVEGNQYRVRGTKPTPYQVPGVYPVHLAIHQRLTPSDRQVTEYVYATLTVTDPPLDVQAVQPLLTLTYGQPMAEQDLATFVDPHGSPQPHPFRAQIEWGDGNVTDGVITGNGTYTVRGSNHYAEPGKYIARVIVRLESAPYGKMYERTFHVDVNRVPEPPAEPITPTFVRWVLDNLLVQRDIATFTLRDSIRSVADLRASIDWGDGTVSSGHISQWPLRDGDPVTYAVRGDHRYRQGGVYKVRVTIECPACACDAATAVGSIWAQQSSLEIWARPLKTSAARGWVSSPPDWGAMRNVVVASFTDPSPWLPHEYQVRVEWGDGTNDTAGSGGNLRVIESQNRFYIVVLNKAYSDEGPHRYRVTVTKGDQGPFGPGRVSLVEQAYNDVTVASAAAGIMTESRPITFRNLNSYDNLIQGEVVWELGPSRTSSRGWDSLWHRYPPWRKEHVGAPPYDELHYAVGDRYVYREIRPTSVIGRIHDQFQDNSPIEASREVRIVHAPAIVAAVRPMTASVERIPAGSLATFFTPEPNVPASSYQAWVNWGDNRGEVSAVVTRAEDGTYEVSALEALGYRTAWRYPYSIRIQRDNEFSDEVLVHSEARISGDTHAHAPGFGGLRATATGDVVVAKLFGEAHRAVPLESLTATIVWGDGSAPTLNARLQRAPDGTIEVVGTHTYNNAGLFDYRVEIEHIYTGPLPPPAGESRLLARVDGLAAIGLWQVTTRHRTEDPDRTQLLPASHAMIAPGVGAVRVQHPLDFDRSPGTSVGGEPALVYNSATVGVRPIIEINLPKGIWHPQRIEVTFAFAGRPAQLPVIFQAGPSPGDAGYLVAVQAQDVVQEAGIYPWKAHVKLDTGLGGMPLEMDLGGTVAVVVQDHARKGPSPLGAAGWGIAGLSRLVLHCDNQVLWVDGAGTGRVFRHAGGNSYTTPAEDFGTLLRQTDAQGRLTGFLYTAKDLTQLHFDEKGLLRRVVDLHGLTLTYTYDPATERLTGVQAPDGSTTTLAYAGNEVHITEPGNRTLLVTLDGDRNLRTIQDVDAAASTRSFDYAPGTHLLTADQWSPVSTRFLYDLEDGRLSTIRQVVGQTTYDHTLVSSAVQGLLHTSAAPASLRQAVATFQDPRNPPTTFTLDERSRLLRTERPLNSVERWQRNPAGDVTLHSDPLNRRTRYTYANDDKGDLLRVDYHDGSFRTYAYHPLFHKVIDERNERDFHTTYVYDNVTGDLLEVHRQVSRTPLWSVTRYRYHTDPRWQGLVQFVTDPRNGNWVTEYRYDAARRLEAVLDASPAHYRTTYSYDAAGNLWLTIDPLLRETQTAYDGRNQLVGKIDAAGGLWAWEYFADGSLRLTQDALARQTTYSYDERGLNTGLTEGITLPVNEAQRSTLKQYDAAGNLQFVTTGSATVRPHLATIAYDYDALNRLRSQIEAYNEPEATQTTYLYDAAGNLRWETSGSAPVPTYALRLVRRYGYDLRDRQGQLIDAFDQPDLIRATTQVYDAAGNLERQANPRGAVTLYEYDGLNRPTRQYDAWDTLDVRVTETGYDLAGNVIQQLDPRGYVTSYVYDEMNRQRTVTEALGTMAYQRTTTKDYDAVGNLLWVQTPRVYDRELPAPPDVLTHVITSYGYDDLNRRTTVVEAYAVPESGLLTHPSPVTRTAYDAVGNVLSVTDPLTLSRVTSYGYDALDRRTAVYEVWQPLDPTGFQYARASYFRYDAQGNLVREETGDSVSNPHWVATTHAYDRLNRRVETTAAAEVLTPGLTPLRLITTTVYDARGHIVATVDARGTRTHFGFDVLGRQRTVVEAAGDLTYQRTTVQEYDAADNLVLRTKPRLYDRELPPPPGALASVTDRYTYDALNRRRWTGEALDTDEERWSEVGYDAADNVIREMNALEEVTSHEYDPLGRKTATTEAVNDAQYQRTTYFGYDAADNLVGEVHPRVYDHDGSFAPEDYPETRHVYDALDRKVRTLQAANVSEATLGHPRPETATVYDEAGRVLLEIGPHFADVTVRSAVKTIYDILDRPFLVSEGVWRNLAPPDDQWVFEAYRFSTRRYNAADSLVEQVTGYVPEGSPFQRHVSWTTYAYDAANRRTFMTEGALTPEARTTAWEYDGNGNVTLVRQLPLTSWLTIGAPPSQHLIEQLRQSKATKFSYDPLNRRTEVIEGFVRPGLDPNDTLPGGLGEVGFPLGHAAPRTVYEHDAADNLVRVTNPRLVVATYGYDALNRRVRSAEAAEYPGDLPPLLHGPAVTVTGYDQVDNVQWVRDPLGTVTTFAYDPLQRRTTVIEALGQPEQRQTTMVYDAANQLERITQGVAAPTQVVAGQTFVRQHRVSTRFYTNALNRQVEVHPAADLTDQQVVEQFGHVRPITTTVYDAAGRVVEERTPYSTTTNEYDELGRRNKVIEGANVAAERRITVTRHDAVGNVIWTWNSQDVRTAFTYDTLNRQTVITQGANLMPAEQLRTTFVYYSALDQVRSRQTPLGTTVYDYDRLGRQRQVREVNSTGNGFFNNRTEFYFDAANNRTAVRNIVTGTWIDGGQPTFFTRDNWGRSTFDPLNRPVRFTDPMEPTPGVATYAYDAAGRLIGSTDRGHLVGRPFDAHRGRRLYEYDRLGHLTKESWHRDDQAQPETIRQFVYDASDNLRASFLGGAQGLPITFLHLRTFDALNRLHTDTPTFGGRMTYSYDAGNRVRDVADAYGGLVSSEFDAANRLTRRAVRNTEDGLQRRVQVDYEPDPTGGRLDRVDTITYQQANGTRQLDTLFASDDLARTTLIHHRRTDESTLEQMEYRYKPNGPLELEQRQGFYSYTLTYDYDPRGQVTTQRFDEGNGPVPTTFAYDSNGNPILSVAPAYGNRVTTTPTGRQLVYEPEGNVIELYDPVASDTWGWRFRMRYDQANRLVETQGGWFLQSGQQWSQALSVRYDYDAEGKLVQRWQEVLATFTLDFGGAQPREFRPDRDTRVERFVYQGEHVAFELNAANQLEVRYLRGDRVDQLWGQFFYDYGGQSWTADWYLTDQQGSVLAQVGDDGRLFKKLRYQGTLADRREGGDWRDRYEYSGRELDYASGQQYHRTRWYAPITGRWLSEDPASPELGHTNPYTYVHNSWPNGTAPNGEVPEDQKWLVPTGNETVRNVVGWLYDHQLPLFLSLDKQDGQKVAAGIWDTAYGFSPFGMFENLAPRDAATGEFNWTFRGEVTNRLWYGAQKDYQGYRKAGYFQADALGYTWMSRVPVLSTVMRLQELDSRFSLQGTSLGQKLTPGDVMLNAFHSIADVATTALALTGFAATIAGPAKAAGGVAQASRWSAVRASVAWRAASATAEAVSLVSGLPLPTAALGSARLALGLAGRGLGLGIKAALPRLQKGISQAAHAQGQWYQRPMRSVADWMRIEACFAAGTPLRTPDGSKLIDHFQAGDRILARDETNPDAPIMVSVVEEVFVRLGRIMVLRVGGQVVRTTAEHPFWRKDAGWTPCGELRASDLLCTDGDQWVSVEEVHDTGEYETVYNLRVADFHTYFVGCDEWGFSVWAHNQYKGLRAGFADTELRRHGMAYIENLQARVAAGKAKASWRQIEQATGRTFDRVERMAIRQFAEHAEGLGPVLDARGLTIQVSSPRGPVGTPETEALTTRWARSFAEDVGATVESGPRPYGRGEHWLTHPVTKERVGRLDLRVRVPASEGLADPVIHVNTVTMREYQGVLAVHRQQEVAPALRIRAHFDDLGVGGTMILIPKTANGGFYLVPTGGGNPIPIPEFANARGLVNYLKQGG